jgi:hypothetical protein
MLEIKNKRLKMSPGGVVSLPVAARKALGMKRGVSANVGIKSGQEGVTLIGKPDHGCESIRISKRGQVVALTGEAQSYLGRAMKRHYWIQLDDDQRTATLKAC